MYDEDMMYEKIGFRDGEPVEILISEPDSFFPNSLSETFPEIKSAQIVGEDELGRYGRTRPKTLKIDENSKTYIHAPYNMQGHHWILHRPKRFLRIVLEKEVHYFPFGGNDEKREDEEEWLELFDDSLTDIKDLREAAKAILLLEDIESDLRYESGADSEIDDDLVEEYINALKESNPIITLSDYFKKAEKVDSENEEYEDGENAIERFMAAIRWTTEKNLENLKAWENDFYELRDRFIPEMEVFLDKENLPRVPF